MLGKLAFRNVLRNQRRTFLTALLIGFGLGTLILHDGLVHGMTDAMIANVTGNFLGQAQIHAQGFRQNPDVDRVIHDWPSLEENIRSRNEIAFYTPRTKAQGMISSPQNVSVISIFGIEPEAEAHVSKLKRAIIQGEYLTGHSDTEILIGRKLAKLLEVEIGDRVVLTAAQAESGELAQELFRISGIIEFKTKQMDEGAVFVSIARAQKLLNLKGRIHEVAFTFKDMKLSYQKALLLWSELSKHENEALGWKDLAPAIGAMLDMSQYSTLISGSVLFGVIILSVINSIFMSIYERMFEFGVLKAVGTRPYQIFSMILLEAGVLSVLSALLGMVLGGLITVYFRWHGFDFSGVEYSGASFTDPIRTVLRIEQFTNLPFFVVLLTLLASLYPAIHAARLIPTKAMRKSL